jgi:hypothetical protein
VFCAETVKDKGWVPLFEAASVTFAVKLKVPVLLVVPLIVPVLLESESPEGRLPEEMLQV